ncbi:MAG: alpha/beta fold hydrolase [Isosphaeraceae bacterium]
MRLPLLGLLFLSLGSATASAQDLGSLLEGIVRQELRKGLDPARLERAWTPTRPSAPQGIKVDTHAIKTRDGWTLVAFRYRMSPPVAPVPAQATLPVILCHGLTYNARFWDLDSSCSFAEYLAGRGMDVWVVNLRGCGQSQKWVWSLENAPEALISGVLRRSTRGKLGATAYASLDPKYAQWTMDDHIVHDVPALVYLVKRLTGAPEVAWVGHSMGGIVALAHLSRFQNPGIGRLVAIGSQFTMPEGQVPAQFLRELLITRERQVSGTVRGPELVAQSLTSAQNLFFNVRNVSPEVYQALTTEATDVPSVGLLTQYLSLADRGSLFDASRRFEYASGLPNIRIPVLLGCGAADRFAPPKVQKFLYDRIGSPDKTLVVFGRAGGYSVDAGHNDALVGLNSRDQVYPLLHQWLSTPRPAH